VVGVQVPPEESNDWQTFLDGLGYRYVDETENPAYRLFLGEVAGTVGVG
jgi:threonine dehydratase